MTIAKFRLHATKVDRIAIVDRPAVPDAEILLFKRREEDDVKVLDGKRLILKAVDFNGEFIMQSSEGAVSALEAAFWTSIFDDEMDAAAKTAHIEASFKDFTDVVLSLVDKAASLKQEGQPTASEVEESFNQSMVSAAINDAFSIFRSHLGFFVANAKEFDEAKAIVTRLIESFKTFVLAQTDAINTKQLKVEKSDIEALKAGRKLSGARLKKLKELAEALQTLITEVEAGEETKGGIMKEKGKGTTHEKQMTLEELTAAVGSIQEELKTRAETFAAIETRIVALEEAVGKQGDGQKQAEVLEANRLAIEAMIRGDAEVKETVDAVQAAVGESDKRLGLIEKTVKSMVKGYEAIAKRMGHQTSLVDDGGGGDGKGKDPFGAALRAKKGVEKK